MPLATTLVVTNRDLQPIHAFLTALPLAGAASRARSKILAMIEDAITSLGASELELVTEHAQLDDNNQPVIDNDGGITFPTPNAARAFLTAREQLLAEQAILTGQSYTTMAPTLLAALESYDQPLTGEQAQAYDRLCDCLEAATTPTTEDHHE